MNDVADNAGHEAPPTLGEALARGREEQGLTRNDVAQRLHMSPNQVEALESGDYARLPKGPFLRGFVRNYAKLVALDPNAVLPLLADAAPRETAPGIVVPTQNIRFDPLGERFTSPWVRSLVVAFVVICIGFAVMYWWVYVRPQPPGRMQAEEAVPPTPATEPAPAPPTSQPVQIPEAPAQASQGPAQTSSAPVQPATGAPPGTGPAAGTASTPAAAVTPSSNASAGATAKPPASPSMTPSIAAPARQAPSNAAPAAKGARRLHFRFKGESWVEVRDASGRIVFQQLNPAGGEADVSGKPPLQVVVGNAPEVEMDRDGQPFDLAPSSHVGVARLTVE